MRGLSPVTFVVLDLRSRKDGKAVYNRSVCVGDTTCKLPVYPYLSSYLTVMQLER